MGREIRRVPPNWNHPKEQKYDPFRRETEEVYQPMRDEDFESAMKGWLSELELWLGGEFLRVCTDHPDLKYSPDEPYRAFYKWNGGAPELKYYRPVWKEGEATAYQVYETVSEGTPISPVFATKQELICWLVEDGSDMGIGCDYRMTPEQAENFVNAGSAPSMIMTPETGPVSGLEIHK